MRDWAVAEPARYALLYGSPVPGYRAPAERTTGPGTRVILAVVAPLVPVWTSVFGLVSFEVFGQYGADIFSRPAQLFDAQ